MSDESTAEIFRRIERLREQLFAAIDHSIEMDGHHKSYEGRIGIIWPHRFNDTFCITLDCYVIGPGRHHAWYNTDLSLTLDEAERDITKWIQEEYECDHDWEDIGMGRKQCTYLECQKIEDMQP